MKTLGFELIDAGCELALGHAPATGGPFTVERLSPPGPVAALALAEDANLHFGAEAEQRRFLLPRQMNETFWEELSLQPSPVRRHGRALSVSELAFHFLDHLVRAAPTALAGHDSIVLALPAAFLDETPRAEERIGILLGMCRDLELKVSSLVDTAAAALLDPAGRLPARGLTLVIDLGLHAAQLSLFEVGASVTRKAGARLAGTGRLALVEAARRALASRFLRQTSFDVTAERGTEQAFHDQTLDLLDKLSGEAEAWLRITSGGRERSVSVPRDVLIAELKGLADAVAQAAHDLARSCGRDLATLHVVVTARARQLAGLRAALRSRGAITVEELAPGAAARAAATLAFSRTSPADLGDVPTEVALALPEAGTDASAAVRAAFVLNRAGTRREQGPTHVVIDGIAHPLRNPGLRIATHGDARTSDYAVSVVPAGLGRCDIVVQPGTSGWTVSVAFPAGETFVPAGAEIPLAPGDALEVHGTQGSSSLMFVRVDG